MGERKIQTTEERAEWRAKKLADVRARHEKHLINTEAVRKPRDLSKTEDEGV